MEKYKYKDNIFVFLMFLYKYIIDEESRGGKDFNIKVL